MLNLSVFNENLKKFKCSKCENTTGYTFPLLANDSNTVSIACSKCKQIEFYDYYILDRKFKG